MIDQQEFSISGLLPIAGSGPGFATPLFVFGGSSKEHVQQIDEDGFVTGFIPANIPERFPVVRSVAPERQTIGRAALYGLTLPGNAPLVAEKPEMVELSHLIDPQLKSFPFIRSQFANFVGNIEGQESASEQTGHLLKPGCRREGKLDELSDYLISKGRVYDREIQAFSLNSIFTIQNAVRFVDDLLINDTDDQYMDLRNWANNTPFEFSIENVDALLHYVGAEAIYVSYLSGLKYDAPLVGPFSSPGQESITFCSSIDGAMQNESQRYALFNRYANHDAFSSVTFQSTHSRVQGKFLDVRGCDVEEKFGDSKLLSSVGDRIAAYGYDGVIFAQPNLNNKSAFAAVSYGLHTVNSVIEAGMFNLAHVAVGHPTWSHAIELV